jgi:hypothetical protein
LDPFGAIRRALAAYSLSVKAISCWRFSVMDSEEMMASIFFALREGISASKSLYTKVHWVLMRLHSSLAKSMSKPTNSPLAFLDSNGA